MSLERSLDFVARDELVEVIAAERTPEEEAADSATATAGACQKLAGIVRGVAHDSPLRAPHCARPCARRINWRAALRVAAADNESLQFTQRGTYSPRLRPPAVHEYDALSRATRGVSVVVTRATGG